MFIMATWRAVSLVNKLTCCTEISVRKWWMFLACNPVNHSKETLKLPNNFRKFTKTNRKLYSGSLLTWTKTLLSVCLYWRFCTETQLYKSVVIINNKANINSIADLQGKRSCHGAYNSTYGWDIPIGVLLATMTMNPDCRGEMYSVSKFFDQSCAPGKLLSCSVNNSLFFLGFCLLDSRNG